MKNESTKTGLVGFFDILGYQNLLERNEPEKIAEEVLPILTNIDKTVIKDLKELTNHSHSVAQQKFSSKAEPETLSRVLTSVDKLVYKIIKALRWIIFSDTVVLTLPIENKDHILVQLAWWIFFAAAVQLQTYFFQAGLPIRGAIDYGKFFIKDTCFAGRTIINAYQLCSQIEIAACVLTDDASKKLRQIKMDDHLFALYIVEYLIPTKSGEKHMLTVRANTYKNPADIHNEVMRAFWGNRKDISISARQKAQKTEQWLEFLMMEDDSEKAEN
jgi:hypothetical protein